MRRLWMVLIRSLSLVRQRDERESKWACLFMPVLGKIVAMHDQLRSCSRMTLSVKISSIRVMIVKILPWIADLEWRELCFRTSMGL